MAQSFPPSEEFRRTALIRDETPYREAAADTDGFWSGLAGEFISWFEKSSKGMEWDPPHVQWFADGVLNASWECLDKQIELGRATGSRTTGSASPSERRET